MALARPDDPRFTYGDYVQWSNDERWELVDGVAFDMSPAPTREHQRVLTSLVVQVGSSLRGRRCELYVAPFDVRLPASSHQPDDEIADVVQPDLVVVCDPTKLDERGCRGAPDWVVEILSPRTSVRDQVVKRDLYERHGVREYWIVDLAGRCLLRYERTDSGFAEAIRSPLEGRTTLTPLPGLRIDWSSVVAS